MGRPVALPNTLNPLPALRIGRWWAVALPFAVAIGVASVLASTVAVQGTPVSPIYLPLGIGVAVLAVSGRALWPAFLIGDAVGMALSDDRAVWLMGISVAVHLVLLLAGATLIQRRGAWLLDLGSSARYLVISVGLAACGGLLGLLIIGLQGPSRGPYGPGGDFATWFMGDLSGYLVGGALVLAWTAHRPARERVRPTAIAGLGIVAAIGVWMVVFPSPIASVVGLIAIGLIAMRFGVRAGTAATAMILGALLADAARGTGDLGGTTPDAQAFNAMLGVAIAASAALMLAGYREGVAGRALPSRTVVLVAAGTLLAAGVATFATSQLTADRGYPLATTCLFYLAGAAGLGMVRGARRPDLATSRRATRIAIAAGVISAVSLALYYASLPRLGVGAGTGLSMTAPAFIVAIVAVTTRRIPPLPSIVGAGAIACGALAITAARGGGEPAGIAIALLGALAFATFVTVLAVALRDGSPVQLALVVSLSAGVASGAIAVVVEGARGFAVTPAELAVIAFGAIGGGAIPTLVRAWSLPTVGAPTVGALGVLSPVMTALLSMVLLDTGRSPLASVGIAVIAVGAATAALGPVLGVRRAV